MKHLRILGLTVATLLAAPHVASAQSIADLIASVQRGGGWVSVPIEDGDGRISTAALPTVGMTVAGCVQVWRGHTGEWTFRARDTLGEGQLDFEADPGESVPFRYTSGMRSRLEVDVTWSEPRDTTLFLWVGLSRPDQDAAATCEPTEDRKSVV